MPYFQFIESNWHNIFLLDRTALGCPRSSFFHKLESFVVDDVLRRFAAAAWFICDSESELIALTTDPITVLSYIPRKEW